MITYNGPDTDYTGQEILIGSNENEVVIVDITDKTNPTRISTIDYANIGYTHQGWFTEDFRYFILGDELDERNFGINTRNIIFDFSDLDNPIFFTWIITDLLLLSITTDTLKRNFCIYPTTLRGKLND